MIHISMRMYNTLNQHGILLAVFYVTYTVSSHNNKCLDIPEHNTKVDILLTATL